MLTDVYVGMCRALSLVATGTDVERDMFYNGDVKDEPGAVVCRVAPSFVRFGTFQLPVSRREPQLTKALADYVILYHFSELQEVENKYLALLEAVVERTASLVVQWQLIGFVHGACLNR
jgi:serine/tyrosine/threonine adenylyltransferase